MQYTDIPEEVKLALGNDDLVLFCGAGVSAQNGLPLFKDLVEQICTELLHINIKADYHPKERQLLKEAWKSKNYDNVLGLVEAEVSRRTLRKKVITILNNATRKADTNIHKSLLELSALEDKKGYRLVTTNFDRLFFKAELNYRLSDSAPKLAPPRKDTWNHLTFLHGVIDKDSDPLGSNLILTRRDFGLAYLYDNWASRFIIQLFQDFTILFIGYGVNDPVMNYLVSAISYENQRRKENQKNGADNGKIKKSIYAFVGYKEGEEKSKKNKWKSIGVEPIPYKIKVIENKEGKKKKEDHSLLYNTIKEWADWKRMGFIERKNRLKEKVKIPYKESDKKTAESVISSLKVDERLAQYFPQINLSSDPSKIQPVDISWLKPFTERNLLSKLTNKIPYTQPWILWEKDLCPIEDNMIIWFCHHLDKKKLIHWVIDQGCILHPYFKEKIRKKIEERNNRLLLDERKQLFWQIITSNNYFPYICKSYYIDYHIIKDLNEQYCKIKTQRLLECMKPYIHFSKFNISGSLYERNFENKDIIYKPELKVNIDHYPDIPLENETALLLHAEDFSNLLKQAMELAKLSGIIKEDGRDPFHAVRRSVAGALNEKAFPWTYLIDLVRDSFDCAMRKNEELAKLLLKKWQYYPYSIFKRLIIYAVTNHPLDEQLVVDMFEE